MQTLDGPLIVTGVDLDGVQKFAVAGGAAVLFTRGAPGLDAPNEDGAALLPAGAGRSVLAVADGVGGQPGGESASARLLGSLEARIRAVAENDALRPAVLDGVEEANRALREEGRGAASTLVAVEVEAAREGARIRPYHVGDSMIVLLGQRGVIKLQTVAHSPVGYALEAGVLDEQEALHHAERHLISNAVGTENMRIEIGSQQPMAARDTLVLGSDGVFDNLSTDELADIVCTGSLEDAGDTLLQICHARMTDPETDAPSKPDDLSFILFRRG